MARTLGLVTIKRLQGPLKVLRGGPRLLVLDFDGTLSPIAARPNAARLSPRAARALTALRGRAGVTLAVLSGRSLESLRRLLPTGLVLVGNHGLRASRPGLGLDPAALAPYRRAVGLRLAGLRRLARGVPGALVEDKHCDVALHFRQCAASAVPGLLSAARALFRGSGLRARGGKAVLEWGPPLGRGKAGGLRRLAGTLAPGWREKGACLFVGDDRTDETAFAATAGWLRLLTVKVGPGLTAAAWRLTARSGVDALLEALARNR